MLRFKADDGSDFPEWQEKEFGSLVNEFVEKTVVENEDILLSCTIDGIYLNSEVFSHQRGSSNIGYKKIYKNTLILSAQNLHLGNANVNLVFEHGMISPAYKTFNLKGCVPEFIEKWIKRPKAKRFFYDATTTGASQCRRNVVWKDLYQQVLLLPSLPEQRKIATFLSTIDEIIAAIEAEVSAWEERKKGVMQKLFSQEVRFKTDDGSDFPEWEEKQINSFANCFAGATPSTKISEYWDNGTVSWMSSGEVNNREIFKTEKKITKFGFEKSSTKMIKVNTVVMALAGQGKTRGMVAITRIPLCTNQSLCAIETNDTINDNYLYQYLTTQYDILRRISSGDGTRGGLNLQLVGEFRVPLPSFPEQKKIAACLFSFDDVINQTKAELAAWQELKKGMLQQMFV